MCVDLVDAVLDGGKAGLGAREECFLEYGFEEMAAWFVLVDALKRKVGKEAIGFFFWGGGLGGDAVDLALFKAFGDLCSDIFLEASDIKSLDIFFCVLLGICECRGIEHIHKAGKAFRLSVVGGCRKHDQSIRTFGEKLREFATFGGFAACGDIVCFVDDDDIPVGLFEGNAVSPIVFEGIDRDDGFVDGIEGVVVGGDMSADTLKAGRIEPCERDGEAIPHLFLKLGEHTFDGDNHNALGAATSDQFSEQDSCFEGFSEADSVGDEDALAGLFEGFEGGFKLVG